MKTSPNNRKIAVNKNEQQLKICFKYTFEKEENDVTRTITSWFHLPASAREDILPK
jgi:hypothetical protein